MIRDRRAISTGSRFEKTICAGDILYIMFDKSERARERERASERERGKKSMCMSVRLCACGKERKMRFLESIDRLAEVVRTGH